MSYASDDLVPMFMAPSRDSGVGFRQGVILAYNPETAENTVRVGSAVFTNLPILNTSEAALLTPGAVVGIQTVGASRNSWYIIGRITVPGTPEAASTLSLISQRIVAASDPGAGTRTSSTFGDLSGAAVGPEVTVNISRSGKALVLWSAGYGNTEDLSWEPRSTAGISVQVSGATTIAPSGDYSLGHDMHFPVSPNPGAALTYSSFQNSLMHLFTDLNPGSNTFTLKYRNLTDSTDCVFATREIAVFAL